MKTKWFYRSIVSVFLIATLGACRHSKKSVCSPEIAKSVNAKSFKCEATQYESDFIVDVVAANYGEIKFARLAIRKTLNTRVKTIAYTLERDHSAFLVELKGFANRKRITIPVEETEDEKYTIKDLKKKDLSDFDKKWCKEMVTKHERTIQQFELMFENTHDPELKAWIYHALPGLKAHLEELVEYQDKFYTTNL